MLYLGSLRFRKQSRETHVLLGLCGWQIHMNKETMLGIPYWPGVYSGGIQVWHLQIVKLEQHCWKHPLSCFNHVSIFVLESWALLGMRSQYVFLSCMDCLNIWKIWTNGCFKAGSNYTNFSVRARQEPTHVAGLSKDTWETYIESPSKRNERYKNWFIHCVCCFSISFFCLEVCVQV